MMLKTRRRTGSARAPNPWASSVASAASSGAASTEAQQAPESWTANEAAGVGMAHLPLTVIDTSSILDTSITVDSTGGARHVQSPTRPQRLRPGRGRRLLLQAVRRRAGQGRVRLRHLRQ